jgi:hypothetical protein
VRRYKAKQSEFAWVATHYAQAAAERMDQMKGIDDGRRISPVVETFDEAKKRVRFFPRPRPYSRDEECQHPLTSSASQKKAKHG